jgi:Sec-independent protein translocase protein TatA
MVRLFPLPEIIIVLALAAIVFGPRNLWQMRQRHRQRRISN